MVRERLTQVGLGYLGNFVSEGKAVHVPESSNREFISQLGYPTRKCIY